MPHTPSPELRPPFFRSHWPTSQTRRRPSAAPSIETACNESRTLGEICGCRIWLKFENLQFTATFKERGALNRLNALSAEERKRGVIAMSAGNHAQGVAYHAKRLGIPATIVMPVGTPMVKVENTRRHGADDRDLRRDAGGGGEPVALDHGEAHGLTLVHPYDDPLIIAGQGTIGLEMLKAVPELDTLVVPIGGGGLISGIAIAAKSLKPELAHHRRRRPSSIRRCTTRSRASTCRCAATRSPKASRSRRPGKSPRRSSAHLVDDIVLVTEAEIERAVATLISIEKTVVEGAGAAGLAALLADPGRCLPAAMSVSS